MALNIHGIYDQRSQSTFILGFVDLPISSKSECILWVASNTSKINPEIGWTDWHAWWCVELLLSGCAYENTKTLELYGVAKLVACHVVVHGMWVIKNSLYGLSQ